MMWPIPLKKAIASWGGCKARGSRLPTVTRNNSSISTRQKTVISYPPTSPSGTMPPTPAASSCRRCNERLNVRKADLPNHGQYDPEFGAAAFRAHGGDQAVVFLDDFFGDRQPDARAFESVLRMQTLEQRKDAGKVFFLKPYSIVADADLAKGPVLRFKATKTPNTQAFGIDIDPRRHIGTGELQGIAEDILKDLSDLS